MIGRDAERRRIGRFLAEGARRHTVCLLSGDAGLGKSTLLAAALEAARRRGTTTLHAAPTAAERDLPFSTLGDLLGPEAPTDPPALLRRLREAAVQAPLLIALDDVDSVDDSSWHALLFALRRVEGNRVAVLVAVRSPESSARAGAVLRSAGTGRVHRIRLEPLAGDEIEQVLRAQGLLPARRAARSWVIETAGGNPYAALELAAAVAEDDARGLPEVIPQALSTVLRRALAGIPAPAARALLTVALAGRATRDLAERLLGRGGDAALDDALRRGLLVERDGGLRPAHPLLAAAAVDAASSRERRALHRRLSVEAADAVERGLHLARATAAANAAAATSVASAAAVALRRGAPAEAARLYGHAVRLTPAAQVDERVRRSLARADALAAAGEPRQAVTVLEDVVGRLEPGDDRASALARLGALRYRVDRTGVAVRTFRDALAEAGDEPELRTDVLRRLSLAAMMSGDLPEAAAVAEQASVSASASALPSVVAETARFQAMVSTVIGLPGAAELAAAPEGADGPWRPDVPVELRPATIRALAANVLHGDAAAFDELCRRADRDGDSASVPYLLANLCEARLAAGEWDEADALAVRARMLLDDEPDAMSAFLLAALSRHAACRGRVTEARALGLRGLNLARQAGMLPAIHYNEATLGFLDLSRGRHGAVDARLGGLVDGLAALGLGEPMLARFVPDLIESRIRVGDLDGAETALAFWEERGRTLGRPFAWATAARCRALLLGSADDIETAREHHAFLGEPFELARTELVAGLVHRRARRRGLAHAAFTAALETFQSLGAPLWAAAADAELARLGTRPRRTGPGDLTESERRIVELVAAGRTNRESALELFVAESTVEASLWRIYRKLGVRSRTELTRWALAPRPRAGRAAARPPRA